MSRENLNEHMSRLDAILDRFESKFDILLKILLKETVGEIDIEMLNATGSGRFINFKNQENGIPEVRTTDSQGDLDVGRAFTEDEDHLFDTSCQWSNFINEELLKNSVESIRTSDLEMGEIDFKGFEGSLSFKEHKIGKIPTLSTPEEHAINFNEGNSSGDESLVISNEKGNLSHLTANFRTPNCDGVKFTPLNDENVELWDLCSNVKICEDIAKKRTILASIQKLPKLQTFRIFLDLDLPSITLYDISLEEANVFDDCGGKQYIPVVSFQEVLQGNFCDEFYGFGTYGLHQFFEELGLVEITIKANTSVVKSWVEMVTGFKGGTDLEGIIKLQLQIIHTPTKFIPDYVPSIVINVILSTPSVFGHISYLDFIAMITHEHVSKCGDVVNLHVLCFGMMDSGKPETEDALYLDILNKVGVFIHLSLHSMFLIKNLKSGAKYEGLELLLIPGVPF